MSDILARINSFLEKSKVVETVAEVEPSEEIKKDVDTIRHALSGAFGEAIEVYLGEGKEAGCLFADVPLTHIKASGLKMVETACPPRWGNKDPGRVLRVVIGNAEAVQNATNRVSKPLGEKYNVKIDSFNADADSVYFRIDRV